MYQILEQCYFTGNGSAIFDNYKKFEIKLDGGKPSTSVNSMLMYFIKKI